MKTKSQVRSIDDLAFVTERCEKILTLFSGGVDSSYVLKKLAETSSCEIVALTIDLGDGVSRDDLRRITDHFGVQLQVVDARERFVREAVLPALRCNAHYMSMFPISASLSRPLISKIAVEVAAERGCEAIIHTANQSQNSLRRLNGAIHQLGFPGYYGTPYEYTALSREEKIAELAESGLTSFQARGTSGDSNLWCREFESGTLDNPESFSTDHDLFDWSVATTDDKKPNFVSITYRQGIPVMLNGVASEPLDIISVLNRLVGAFGIGRYAGLEHLEHGEKVLEVREAPAAHLLMGAYRHLEMACLDAELLREKLALEQLWVREAVEGRWYGQLRTAIDQFVLSTSAHVSGTVGYNLRSGAADVCSIRAEKPQYLTDRDTWEKHAAWVRGSRSLEEMHRSVHFHAQSLRKPIEDGIRKKTTGRLEEFQA